VATKIEKKFVILDEDESTDMDFANIISICTGEGSLYVIICIITCLGKYDLKLLMFEKKTEIITEPEIKIKTKKVEENVTKIYLPIENTELQKKKKEMKLKENITTASIYFKVSLYRCSFIIQNYRFLQTRNSRILMLMLAARLTCLMFLVKPCSIHINMMPPPTCLILKSRFFVLF
jgi:hypothetical protein